MHARAVCARGAARRKENEPPSPLRRSPPPGGAPAFGGSLTGCDRTDQTSFIATGSSPA
jgi:hypothetical protein